MRFIQIDISEIEFQRCEYRQSMYDSIKRMGLSFPIKVSYEDGKYYCHDGHKRLSAISDMALDEIYQKRRKINIVIINNGDLRSNDCWRSRNTH